MNDVRARAERFVRSPVQIGDLALTFEETSAATVEVHVAGRDFFPLILADIASATSSVHVNQYGFRPGEIGEQFARAMLAKVAEGVAVRVVVDRVGSRAAAQRFHHRELLDAGVRILGYPAMLHAKAFVRDGEEVLAGTCNLEAWSLKRFFEIDVRVRSREFATQFDERFSVPAEAVSTPGGAPAGIGRLGAAACAAISPLL